MGSETNAGNPPTVTFQRELDRAVLRFAGRWKLDGRLPLFEDLRTDLQAVTLDARELKVSLAEDSEWDASILEILRRLRLQANERGLTWDDAGLPEGLRKLVRLAVATPEKAQAEHDPESERLLFQIGQNALHLRKEADLWFEFIGLCFFSFLEMGRLKAQMRWRDFWVAVEEVSIRALPIVALISFLVGAIITFLGIVVLVRFNAEYYVSYLVGYGMLREMGALMTGIILAGRTSASYAAAIGSMQVNEEIDALRAMGVNPVEFLVLPRILALVLMMPLLTVFADVIGIFTGMAMARSLQDMDPRIFVRGLLEAVKLGDLLLGLVKSLVFGLIIAMSGCLKGLYCGRDANAVGAAVTSAVVTAIVLIVFFNAVIDWIATLYNV